MTGLEIILSIALYLALGLWICQKREWYYHSAQDGSEMAFLCVFALIFMPINFIVVFIKEFVLRKWDN